MKKFIIAISMILLPMLCAAQEAGKVIYLNNGSHFVCTVVGETPTTVTVQNEQGETSTYNKVEVKMISDKPMAIPGSTEYPAYTDYSSLTHGFWAGVDLSGGYNIHNNDGFKGSVPVEMDVIAGYRFNKFAQIGVGAGVKFHIGGNDVFFKDGRTMQFSIPLFFNARGIFIDDRSRTVIPCWSANIGYTFNCGFMFSPALGIRIGSLERHHCNVYIAYTLQQAYNKPDISIEGLSLKQSFLNALSLRVGYQF